MVYVIKLFLKHMKINVRHLTENAFLQNLEEIMYKIQFQISEELKEKSVDAFPSNQCLIPQSNICTYRPVLCSSGPAWWAASLGGSVDTGADPLGNTGIFLFSWIPQKYTFRIQFSENWQGIWDSLREYYSSWRLYTSMLGKNVS